MIKDKIHRSTMKWLPLEFQLYNQLRKLKLNGRKAALLVSGGCDSTATLMAFKAVHSALNISIEVIHFHHGQHQNKKFRNQSAKFVEKICHDFHIPFRLIENFDYKLKSEMQLREFRLHHRQQLSLEFDFFVLGHHRDDLLETRLLRLIRGTGVVGIKALSVYSRQCFRPWLQTSRKELEEYMGFKKQKFLTDPSHADLRSWIRMKWLTLLEKRNPGSAAGLARSLEILAESLSNSVSQKQDETLFENRCLNLQEFLCLTVENQKASLARYMLLLEHRDFSRGYILEVLKNLDKVKKEHTFRIGRLEWHVNAKQIEAKKCVP